MRIFFYVLDFSCSGLLNTKSDCEDSKERSFPSQSLIDSALVLLLIG